MSEATPETLNRAFLALLLAFPASFALLITLRNKELLHDCYDGEIQKRKAKEAN